LCHVSCRIFDQSRVRLKNRRVRKLVDEQEHRHER
jgi:hypothetical protein